MLEMTYVVLNAMLGANSKTKLLNSNSVIYSLFSILGGLAAKNRWPTRAGRGEQNIYIVYGAWCTRSYGSLLLVDASPARNAN